MYDVVNSRECAEVLFFVWVGGGGRGKYCGRGNPKGSKPPVSPYALPHPHPTMWCFAALLGGGTR